MLCFTESDLRIGVVCRGHKAVMRPEKVYAWRQQLPPPFDQSRPVIQRRGSLARLEGSWNLRCGRTSAAQDDGRKRRDSAPGADNQADRKLSWLRFKRAEDDKVGREKGNSRCGRGHTYRYIYPCAGKRARSCNMLAIIPAQPRKGRYTTWWTSERRKSICLSTNWRTV